MLIFHDTSHFPSDSFFIVTEIASTIEDKVEEEEVEEGEISNEKSSCMDNQGVVQVPRQKDNNASVVDHDCSEDISARDVDNSCIRVRESSVRFFILGGHKVSNVVVEAHIKSTISVGNITGDIICFAEKGKDLTSSSDISAEGDNSLEA
ncbi:hypothetical protein K7X08_032367 [Anisodus acutangulus]|uniref:Uncharacterized protein n=1 Tax=Anisodus acutangulus TaxID=402998 RepID=A0A9Q1M0V9_9SOLA|nr:hypothetical protein K7X08_032367 [Anisodus acutangulus]